MDYRLTINGDYTYVFKRGERDPLILNKNETDMNEFMMNAPESIEKVGITLHDEFMIHHVRKGADYYRLSDWLDVGITRPIIECFGYGDTHPKYPIWDISDFTQKELERFLEHMDFHENHWKIFNSMGDLDFLKAYLNQPNNLTGWALSNIYQWYITKQISKEIAFEFNYSLAEREKERTYALSLSKEFDEHCPIHQERWEFNGVVIRTPKNYFEVYEQVFEYDSLELMEYISGYITQVYFVCDEDDESLVWTAIIVEDGEVKFILNPFEMDNEAIDAWCLLNGYSKDLNEFRPYMETIPRNQMRFY